MEEKRRHGCLGAWLILMILLNSFLALVYLPTDAVIRDQLRDVVPGWAISVLGCCAVLNVVWAVALWKWKKWGFFGFCLSTGCGVVVNLAIGLEAVATVTAPIAILVLYGVLQIGGDKRGWAQLD